MKPRKLLLTAVTVAVLSCGAPPAPARPKTPAPQELPWCSKCN